MPYVKIFQRWGYLFITVAICWRTSMPLSVVDLAGTQYDTYLI